MTDPAIAKTAADIAAREAAVAPHRKQIEDWLAENPSSEADQLLIDRGFEGAIKGGL